MALESTRRSFIGGLFAAPAVVRFSSLMPIYSRGFIALAYAACTDEYDVIFPSGIIKSEREVWPKLWNSAVRGSEGAFKYCAEIEKKRLKYPVLTGPEKRAAYADTLGLTSNIIEKRFSTFEERDTRRRIEYQETAKIYKDVSYSDRNSSRYIEMRAAFAAIEERHKFVV